MITGRGAIVTADDRKSKSRFGFDMTIPYYSNLLKAVQSTTIYDNDNIRNVIPIYKSFRTSILVPVL